jgi:sortase B
LFEQNNELVGWIRIEGTGIDYPVMQTPSNPDYYLKHSFEKTWSDYGVPYVDAGCTVGVSNNLIIYGHNMKNGTMFHDLVNYTKKDFYEAHPVICFDTVDAPGRYHVIAAFRYNTNKETFVYNEHTDMDEAEFTEYVENCRARSIYDTGFTAEYGDQLITLSTCEYTYTNGRFVVVAKKIVE